MQYPWSRKTLSYSFYHLLLFHCKTFTCAGWKLTSHCCPTRHRVAAALVISTHSPDFPCSPSDFIPSSEGSFPKDSRICQVWSRDFQDWHKDKIQKSFCLKRSSLNPGTFCVVSPLESGSFDTRKYIHEPPLRVYLFKATPTGSVIQYIQPLPPSTQMVY